MTASTAQHAFFVHPFLPRFRVFHHDNPIQSTLVRQRMFAHLGRLCPFAGQYISDVWIHKLCGDGSRALRQRLLEICMHNTRDGLPQGLSR